MAIKNKNSLIKSPSPLTQEGVSAVSPPDYSKEEIIYLSRIRKRLDTAKEQRDKAHMEFDGLTFVDYWWANERAANTSIKPVANKGEADFQTGTLRTKLLSFLSSLISLNLEPDIMASNEHDIPVRGLGQSMEDILFRLNEVDNDDELKMLRQYEMLKHGYVFVEDLWDIRYEVKKELESGNLLELDKLKWKSELVRTVNKPQRSIVPGPCVYLGDIRQYFIEKQPFILTVERKTKREAELTYGKYARWKNVPLGCPANMTDTDWRLLEDLSAEKEEVEIVKYQDVPNDEYQIFINGVPMLPVGCPLSLCFGVRGYSLSQQNFEPVRQDFAYGKSFIFRYKNPVAVLDQMMKLAVQKTQKSFLPPYLNLSQRVVSRNVFMPAAITRGIRPNELVPITDKEAQGVTASEFEFMREVTRMVDAGTVSQTFSGSKERGGNVTATQILELQRQARLMLGLTILSATLLEHKLTRRRLDLVLAFWFDPLDKELDKARGMLRDKYRSVSREVEVPSKGRGRRLVLLTEEAMNPAQVAADEKYASRSLGYPVQLYYLNPLQIKQSRYVWHITVNAKERRSSEFSKILFNSMLTDANNLGLRLNPAHVEERFAQVWEEDPAKLFLPAQSVQSAQPVSPTPAPAARPKVTAAKTSVALPVNMSANAQ